MAPLLASVAASVALGVGVSIAKLARGRRDRQERRLGMLPGERLGNGLQRMALGQLDLALEELEGGAGAPGEKAVHETRKALKRLRALLRMLEGELDAGSYERESAALRDAGRKLAGARDAEVMLATLDALVKSHPKQLSGRGGVIRLRAALLSECEQLRHPTLSDPRRRTEVLAELHACRARIAAWRLTERSELELVEAGLLRLYRQGEQRRHRAAGAKRGNVRKLHEWRKRVKDLRYVSEMLQPLSEEGKASRRSPRGKRARRRAASARKDLKWLSRTARRADQLGELLGEDHDVAVLGERIERELAAGSRAQVRIGGRTGRLLLKIIERRRGKLRKRALLEGEQLYSSSPEKLMRRVRGAQRA